MGVGAGLYMYVVVVQKFTFAISSPDEFLFLVGVKMTDLNWQKTSVQSVGKPDACSTVMENVS